MGNNGSRRNGRVPPHQGPVRHIQHPPGYPGALLAPALAPQYAPNPYRMMYPNYPPGAPVYPTQGYGQSNGQYLMGMPPGLQGYRPQPTIAPPPTPQTVPVPEPQKANTIRNDINLKKATLRLEKDEENPGCHLVAFSFDASVAGSICIFFMVKEDQSANCSLIPQFPEIYKPVRVHFDKGLAQRFRQAPGTGVDLALFEDQDLARDGKNHIFPLVIRAETVPKDPPPEYQPSTDGPLGAPLPSWVHAQTTYAQIEHKDDADYGVKVLKQMIWVEGMRYELQEIYGIENSGGGSTYDGGDTGKECVICMSEPRDTTVLPCRHMCMCSECAKVLRFQTNRCPICRCVVERLLEIKVPKTDIDPVIQSIESSPRPPKESKLAIGTVHEMVESSQGSPDGRNTGNGSVSGLDEQANGEHEPQVRTQS